MALSIPLLKVTKVLVHVDTWRSNKEIENALCDWLDMTSADDTAFVSDVDWTHEHISVNEETRDVEFRAILQVTTKNPRGNEKTEQVYIRINENTFSNDGSDGFE